MNKNKTEQKNKKNKVKLIESIGFNLVINRQRRKKKDGKRKKNRKEKKEYRERKKSKAKNDGIEKDIITSDFRGKRERERQEEQEQEQEGGGGETKYRQNDKQSVYICKLEGLPGINWMDRIKSHTTVE